MVSTHSFPRRRSVPETVPTLKSENMDAPLALFRLLQQHTCTYEYHI